MKLSLPPANLRCGKVMFPQASDRQSFCPRGEGGGGSHVTIIHDALEHGTYPAPCIHQTWYLHPPVYDIWLVITGDLFKFFSPEDPSPPPHTVGKQAVRILLEAFLFSRCFCTLYIFFSNLQDSYLMPQCVTTKLSFRNRMK